MEARPDGRRTRGRSRKIYVDYVVERTRQNGTEVTELRKIAGSRRDCRKWIEAVRTLWDEKEEEEDLFIVRFRLFIPFFIKPLRFRRQF